MFSALTRRAALERAIVKGGLVAGTAMSAGRLFALWQKGEAAGVKATPRDVLGPFYKKEAPDVKQLHKPGDPGFPLKVSGRVVNTRGEIVRGARVDIWHADHAGLYDIQGYRYRSKLTPGVEGLYEVDTIMPGHYSDRPAQHIHYLISAPGHKTLVTQVYFATDPFFDGDPDKNYTKRGIVKERELVRPVRLYEAPGTPRAAVSFDIVLERA